MKTIIRITLLTGLFLGHLGVKAQNHTLEGTVRDLAKSVGTPITQVEVNVDSCSYLANTDANGHFKIENIPQGTHNIRVSKSGYVGAFIKNYSLDNNKILNISLVNNSQDSPQGKIPFNLDEFREFPPYSTYTGLTRVGSTSYPSANGSTWNGITEGSLIPIKFVNATPQDSANILAAISEIEAGQGRTMYVLSNGSGIGYTEKGIVVNFNASATNTQIFGYEENSPYIYAVEVNLRQSAITTCEKEIFGRSFSKNDVGGRLSYMNSTSAGITNLDHMLNIVFFNQWAAMARGEQQANIIDFENSPSIGSPISTTFTSPINNSTDLEKNVSFAWKNQFGTRTYELQIATDELFNNVLLDKDVSRIDTTITLNDNTQYYARIRTTNENGSSTWSNVAFKTKNVITLPGSTSITNPTNNSTEVTQPLTFSNTVATNAESYEYIINGIDTGFNLDTTITTNGFTYNKLPGNRTFDVKARAKNSDGNGEWSSVNRFTTYNNAPEIQTGTPNSTTEVNSKQEVVFNYTGLDKDNDALTFDLHLWSTSKDTTIYDISGQNYTLPANKLQPQTAYNYTITAKDGKKSTTSSTQTFNTIADGIENVVSNAEFKVYPNPFDGVFNVSVFIHKATILNIQVVETNGRVISKFTEQVIAGTFNKSYDFSKLGKGVYIFSIGAGEQIITRLLVKK